MRRIYGSTRNIDNGEYDERMKISFIGKLFNRQNIQNFLVCKRIEYCGVILKTTTYQ